MRLVYKIILVWTCLMCAETVVATPQSRDLFIVGNDTLELLNIPLNIYLEEKNMMAADMPWVGRPASSTNLWRGYKATWEIARNQIYLRKIENPSDGSYVDLGKMFGEKYQDNRVLADWINEELFVQYGKIIFLGFFFYSDILERERKYIISQGTIQTIKDYSTLYGSNDSEVIQTWFGDDLDTKPLLEKMNEKVNASFRWTEQMTESQKIEVTLRIKDDFRNEILSEGQFNRSYLGELSRILQPLKIGTLLYMGKPLMPSVVELDVYFDAKKKIVSIKSAY